MKIMGRSQKPVKYSSSQTRFASLHDFQCGADINEHNDSPQPAAYETPNDWNAMNIKSGVNRSDCPSQFGLVRRGIDKIADKVFMPSDIFKGWLRNKGEPVK